MGVVALVTWQALRAQPLLQPDMLTLGALAGRLMADRGRAFWTVTVWTDATAMRGFRSSEGSSP